MHTRSGEYISLSLLTGNRVACKPFAVSGHLFLDEHNISNFNKFWILCHENSDFKLTLIIVSLMALLSVECSSHV